METSAMDCHLDILNNERTLNAINHMLIMLVLKVKETKIVDNFRLISLCTVLYKITAKFIVNWLKLCLNSLISL